MALLKDKTASSSSKRQKSHGGSGSGGKRVSTTEVVGIGRLPDAMLSHILSFLETKDAVQTVVLSKRWRYVWTSVPCIDIDFPKERYFADFFDRLLLLNTVSCLRKFRLSSLYHCYKQHSEWINIMMKRDIEELVLEFGGYYGQFVKLPSSVFTSKKLLVILKLNNGFLLDVPSSVNLPSLKILHIYLGKLFGEDSMTNLLYGCPVIQELNIQGVRRYNMKTLFVRSSSLKSFSIDASSSNDLRIVVNVPNVDRLYLRDCGNAQYDINSLSVLVKVDIYCRKGSGLVKLLGKFTNTAYMFISPETINSLEGQCLDDLPMFHNLTHLVVKIFMPSRSQPVLPYFLECSPNLVTYDYSVSHKGGFREQHLQFKAPKCLMLYLEEINLSGLKGFEDEMEMVRFILKNAKVLKKLSIKFDAGEKKKFEISKKLLTFARGSPDSEVIFK